MEAASLLSEHGCQGAMSAVGRGAGMAARMAAQIAKDSFDPSIVCSSARGSYIRWPRYNCKYEVPESVLRSPKQVHTVVFGRVSMEPPTMRPMDFRSAQRPGAAGIDSVCFLRKNSIDLPCRETCSWVARFQQAIPLSLAAISKSTRHSPSIWLSRQLPLHSCWAPPAAPSRISV